MKQKSQIDGFRLTANQLRYLNRCHKSSAAGQLDRRNWNEKKKMIGPYFCVSIQTTMLIMAFWYGTSAQSTGTVSFKLLHLFQGFFSVENWPAAISAGSKLSRTFASINRRLISFYRVVTISCAGPYPTNSVKDFLFWFHGTKRRIVDSGRKSEILAVGTTLFVTYRTDCAGSDGLFHSFNERFVDDDDLAAQSSLPSKAVTEKKKINKRRGKKHREGHFELFPQRQHVARFIGAIVGRVCSRLSLAPFSLSSFFSRDLIAFR